MLSELSGLSSLTSIGEDLQVEGMHALTDFYGLCNLSSIIGEISIIDNDLLESLSGLDNVDPSGIEEVVISFNPGLAFCAIPVFCEILAEQQVFILFESNAPGCFNNDQVAALCTVNAAEYESAHLSAFPNPAVDFVRINGLSGPEWIEIRDVHGRVVLRQALLDTAIDVSGLDAGHYVIHFTDTRYRPLRFIRQ